MNNKEHFDLLFNDKLHPSDIVLMQQKQRVQTLVNTLIDALYIPILGADNLIKTDPERFKQFNIADYEPVNWGDLYCTGANKLDDGTFEAFIEEASPGECTSLCSYIEKYMASYGWTVKVTTEW